MMIEEVKNQALILKRQDYREYDSLVLLYSFSSGLNYLLARGTKKLNSKLGGHLEPLTLVEYLEIPGKSYNYLAGVKTIEAYLNLKASLVALNTALPSLSRCFALVPLKAEVEPRLFNLAKAYLSQLDLSPTGELTEWQARILQAGFIFRFLTILGFAPRLETCFFCDKRSELKSKYCFDLINGSIVCENCLSKDKGRAPNELTPISHNAIKVLRFLLNETEFVGKKTKISQKIASELGLLADNFLTFRH